MAQNKKQKTRGSSTNRPIMILFDVLGQRWTLRILWELREGALTFRALQDKCESVSPTLLNNRLKELRALQLIEHDGEGYGLSRSGTELGEQLLVLSRWSKKWGKQIEK